MKNQIISGIYKITCITDGKFYIGNSCDILVRWRHYINSLDRNDHGNL